MTETNATPDPPPAGGPAASMAWPPGRYGRRRDPRRGSRRVRMALLVAAALAVVAAGTVLALSLGEQYGPGRPYDVSVARFYEITDSQVVIEFTVAVPDGERAVCAVRARAPHGGEVGRAEVTVDPPAGQTRPQVVHRLATTERPVTGEVQRCWRAD